MSACASLPCSIAQEFSWAVGIPNVVLRGRTTSGLSLELILAVSSPSYNATTRQLSLSATKLGPNPYLEALLDASPSFQLQTAYMVIDGESLSQARLAASLVIAHRMETPSRSGGLLLPSRSSIRAPPGSDGLHWLP